MEKILVVNICLYVLAGAGLFIICEDSFGLLLRVIRTGVRLRRRKVAGSRASSFGIIEKADKLTAAALGVKNGGRKLAGLSALLFVSAALATREYMSIGAALTVSCMTASVPVLFLQLRLTDRRNEGSQEGEAFIAELITVYKLSGCRIDRALEALTSRSGERGIRVCKRLCEDVLSKMRQTGSSENLLGCAEGFAYGIGTKWAELAAYAIGMAAADGTDISACLEDVMMQLREARSLAEGRRRLNGEAGRIVMLMVPAAYAITLLFSVKVLGVELVEILRNQFCTTVGLALFFGIVFAFLVNLLLLSAVRHAQFDY